LHIESVERNKHPMQVMKEYYYINMGSWRWRWRLI
jgi:hypothetical protein